MNKLTPHEELALLQVESSSKWGYVISLLTIIVPCGVFVGFGLWNNPRIITAGGALTFVLIVSLSVPQQIKKQSNLRSAIKKLRARTQPEHSTHPENAGKLSD